MNTTKTRPLTLGSRTSKLALWQSDFVLRQLQDAWPDLTGRVQTFVTKGDKNLDKPLPEIGGKGLFTLELENALRAGVIDLAVHSLKDLPVENATGLTLGAITSRADVRDVLIARQGLQLESLPPGATIGTSSLRRQAQLLNARPDLKVRSIRGNVETRIGKVRAGEYAAAVLAAAGVTRLELEEHVTQWLPLAVMLPAPGQGALAVQCRAGDEQTLRLLAAIDAAGVRVAVTAERSFLAHLGGGCAVPVAAYATHRPDGDIHLVGLVASADGQRIVRVEASGEEPQELAARLARQAIAQGAREILAHV